jgi:DNA-binding MarR family transcriptional regulator
MEVESLPRPPSRYLQKVLEANLRLLDISERLREHWARCAESVGLSGAQVKVLIELSPTETVPMRALARRLDYDASNLTNVVDRLEARGLLHRRPAPADRRVKSVALTGEGRRVREDFWRRLTGTPGPLASLDETDVRALGDLLRKALGEE